MPATTLDAPAVPATPADPATHPVSGLASEPAANPAANPAAVLAAARPQPPLPAMPLEPRPVPPPLTQCPDLASAVGTLEAGLGRCRRHARLAAVLWVDMAPDDSDASRSLLQAMGQRLRHRVRATDSVMQVGCEGFAVLLVDAGDQAAAVVRERLHEALRQPYRVGQACAAPLMLRVGRAVYGLDGQDARALLRVAARLGAADL